MALTITPEAVAQAHEFLRQIPLGAQERGTATFREGHVLQIEQNSRDSFTARVQGTFEYTVHLGFASTDGWAGDCTCPVGFDCKHVYAAMKALLAEHTRDEVQRLSSGTGAPPGRIPPAKAAPPEDFQREVREALGRPLSRPEGDYLRKLTQIFGRCQQVRGISYWDFYELGFRFADNPYQPMKIWPAFPATLREFWQWIAHAASERRGVVPDFMEPVTNAEEIRPALSRWQRDQQVARWKKVLDEFALETTGGSPVVAQQIDLRVRFERKAAALEWKVAGAAEFAAMKRQQAVRLDDDLETGAAQLLPEAEWIWNTFHSAAEYTTNLTLQYDEPEDAQRLGRMLRMQPLRSRLVNETGALLEFHAEPLRWEVDAPADHDGDYRLRMILPAGLPSREFRAVFPGRPALFLIGSCVLAGPAMGGEGPVSGAEMVIPAPAVETPAGVALLQTFGVTLPDRLRERVRMVKLAVTVTAELKPSYVGSNGESCFLTVRADSDDGEQSLEWNGYAWAPSVKRGAKKNPRNRVITVEDRKGLYDPRQLVAPLGARWEPYRSEFSLRVTKKFPDAFATWFRALPPDVKLDLRGDLASLAQDAVVGSVRLEATEAGIDWFDLRVVLDVADTTLSQAELKLLLNARGGFVRLENKGWRRLQFNLSEQEDEQLARLGLTPRELSAEPQRLHALQLADEAAKKFLPEPQFAEIQRRAGEIRARVTPEIPGTINAELRPYQRDGFHFLAYLATNSFGGVLADDMGLGKTLQTLAWFEWLRADGPGGKPGASRLLLPSMVVCPKSVMDNWHAEAARFAPNLRVKVWAAEDAKNLTAQLNAADLHVLNYNQLRLVGESLAPIQWLAVILDEGQYIKNPGSITAQIARSLRAEHRLILSGTPIENRLLDLWSLMSFAMPGLLGSRAQFAKLYDAKEDPNARRRLSARVRPFLLRRTKSQVAKDLPERIEEDLFCEIEGEQKSLYRAELKRAQQMLLRVQTQKQLNDQRFNFLTSLLRLRQICCDPRLVNEKAKGPSAKVEALVEQLEPLIEEGHKVLVFSQFVTMLDLLKTGLEPRGWPLFYLAGDTENRGDLVRQFQAADGAAVFLISLKAGGFGLNLTAASYVVLFDPWWNPAVENQAIDRTHRIGQQRNVIAYRLLIKDSIEEKIRALQKTKSALAEDVLGEEKFSQGLTLDDLRFLFSDG
jgi:hypothetical protein